MPRFKVNDAELYYEVHGQGPTVVFAHGIGGNHASWFYQVATFAHSYQVVTIDHRGFGLSTDPGHRGREQFIGDLKALLDHLEVHDAALVGQSMGGGTVAGFTCSYPERVRALVLADTLAGFAEDGAIKIRMDAVRAATDGLSQTERVLGPRIRAESPALSVLYGQIASFNNYTLKSLMGTPRRWSAAELSATRVPVLFVVGLHDILFPPDVVRMLQAQIPGSHLVEIADTGHSAYFENPVEFNDSVLSFFQAVGFKGARRPKHSNAPGYEPVG